MLPVSADERRAMTDAANGRTDVEMLEVREGRRSVDKQRIRLLLYLGLLLCDIAAIRGGFAIGRSTRGWEWLAPNGVELGWLILPIHILVGLRNGAFAHEALFRRADSVQRATYAFVIATSIIALLIFFQYAGPLVSRIAFGISIIASLLLIVVLRITFSVLFVQPVKGGLMGELQIVDGVPPLPGARHVFDAAAAGVRPDINDPDMLSRLAVLVEPYDRVVVSAPEERRHEWAVLMKAYHVTSEIQLDQGSPLGAIGISRFHGSDTVIVARGPMSLGNRLKKRIMDIAIAGAAVIAAAPLLMIVAIAI